MALFESIRLPLCGIGVRRLIVERLGVSAGVAGADPAAGREVGTGIAPDFPGIFSRASNSWLEPGAH
jgi:hypothetical protein